jgi:hypothetical protein
VYGIQNNPVVWPHVTSDPGSRFEPTYWVTKVVPVSPYLPYDQLWLFGGEGYDSAGTNGNGLLNDLWRYLPYP